MQPSPLTLHSFQTTHTSLPSLKSFYTTLHSKASSTKSILTSLTPLPTLLARLDDLHKSDPNHQLPLHGVPYIAKDNIDAVPHPTTAACPVYTYKPNKQAFIISQLESLGAILLAKANMDQFACGLTGTRSPYGTPLNPYNRLYIPGGSSSGSAVAVASRLCVFSLGTDTAGSGRVPAAMNALVGLKPTKGLLSTSGIVPAAPSLDCVSVFANTVDDAARVLALMYKYDEMNPYTRLPPPGKLLDKGNKSQMAGRVSFRFGVPDTEHLTFRNDSVAAKSFDASVKQLVQLGAECVTIDYKPFAEVASMLYGTAFLSERYAAVGKFIRSNVLEEPSAFDPIVLRIILGGGEQKAHDVFTAQENVLEYIKLAERDTWTKVDVLLLPTVPCAVTLEQVRKDPVELNSALGMYTNFVNLMDYCAIAVPSVPVPDPNHVPRGVTFVGKAFEERFLVQVATAFEQAVEQRGRADSSKSS